jgi:nitrogen fixation/metabolism regulation signal transduction histidine kinase
MMVDMVERAQRGVDHFEYQHRLAMPDGIVTNGHGCLRWLNRETPDLHEACASIERILRDGNRAAAVIERLRALFRKRQFTPESVDLNEATREVVASDAMAAVVDRARQLLLKTERENGDRVRFTVRDAGTGINGQDTDKLFEPFQTTKSSGMGIGLSVSRSISPGDAGRQRPRARGP